mgnify:CR=1 FL=1
MDPITLAAIIGAGAMTGNTLMSKFLPGGSAGMQIPTGQSPNLGQTLMSQRPPMTADQAYPKQQPPQAQNGSLLGNSLYNNPLLQRRMMYG